MTTATVVLSLLALLAISLLLWALFLWIGLRWARVQHVTGRRIALATLLVAVVQFGLALVSYRVAPDTGWPAVVFAMAQLAAGVLIPCGVIMLVFRASLGRSLQAWLPTLLAPAVALVFVLFVFRPWILEAFTTPTNAMAPTLLGNHWQAPCLECGRPAYCSPVPAGYASPEPPLMICGNFHVTQPPEPGNEVRTADRFIVAKYLRPRRWDVVVFRYPEDPSELYVMRLVGLPGEEITIRDGQVWADGRGLTPPESLRGIRYEFPTGYWGGPLWGSPERPARLGAGEYFVLGDFSPQARDSRLWESGAPGHDPFAVPQSHLHGVATHIYWPPDRWRALRD